MEWKKYGMKEWRNDYRMDWRWEGIKKWRNEDDEGMKERRNDERKEVMMEGRMAGRREDRWNGGTAVSDQLARSSRNEICVHRWQSSGCDASDAMFFIISRRDRKWARERQRHGDRETERQRDRERVMADDAPIGLIRRETSCNGDFNRSSLNATASNPGAA